MLSRWSLLLVVLAWSGVLQAQKVSLITSVARNGVTMCVEIKSRALDNIAPGLANYYKEILIDQLARYENPLEAHIDLSRFWFVTDKINKIRAGVASEEPTSQVRKAYESMMETFAKLDPFISTSWEDKHFVNQKMTAQAIAVSTDVAESLFSNQAFRKAFAHKELNLGLNLGNFLSTKSKEFDDAEVMAIDDALLELGAKFPRQAQQESQNIIYLNKLKDQQKRVDYAFYQAVHATLLSKLLDGTDEAFPSLMVKELTHEEDQQAARIIKDIWIAVYRQEAEKD